MNKSPINKIGNTTTTATDTRKKTTAIGIRFNKKPTTKPRRRFGLTCSEKRERAKWAKINEKRRANIGLSKTARKAKNKAAEARITAHKTEVATARRAQRNAKKGIVEEAVVVEEVDEELKPLIAGLFTLLDASSTAPNKALNASLGTFAYEQLVEICTKAMPGPMGRTYAGRFNKAGFVATAVFTETSKTTRKAMLLSKLSDSFVEKHQMALQAKITAIERAVKPVAKKVKASGPVKLARRESVEKTKMVASMIGVAVPAEIDSLESSVVKLEMNNNNDNDITKNNNEEWHDGCGGDGAWSDDEAPDTWDSGSESEPEEEVVEKRGLRAPTSKQLARVNAQRDGGAHVAGLGMKQLEALQRMAEKRPGIEECDVDLVGKSSWAVAKPAAAVKVEVEKPKPKQRALIKRTKKKKKVFKKFLAALQSVAEPVVEQVVAEKKEEKEEADIDMDDLESSDDEDALMVFAKVAKPVAKKPVVKKPVAKKVAKKKVEKVSEATSAEMEAIAKIQQAENLAISQAVAFKPQKVAEKKADFPELGNFPKLDAAIATGRVTTQRGQPSKGKKAMRRRAHGVDVTHLFFSGRQEAKQEAVREAKHAQEAVKEVKVAENARRTDILKMMEARQSEDTRVKALANKPLHFTRRCRGAFNMATGQWKKKVDCTHPRCLFAHSQKQLIEALRGCICTFDGGKGKCRKSATCTFLHTVRATEDSCGKSSYLCKCPRRAETDEEYQARTGFALGEFRDRRSKGNLAKAPTRVSRRTMPSQTRRPVNRQTGFRSKQRTGPTRDALKVTGTMSFASITARAKEKKATPVLKDSEGFTIDPRKYKSGAKKVVASIIKVQAIFRGNKKRVGFSDRLVAFRQERAEIAREQAMRKAAEEHEKRARAKQSSGFNWKPTPKTAVKVVKVVKVAKPEVKATVHTITTLLSEFRLNADVAGKLVQIGAEDVADLKDMEVEDVADLGLKKLEQKRFLKLLDFIKA